MKVVHPDDRLQLVEAVSHILSVVPTDSLDQAMMLFCLPLAQELHEKSAVVLDTAEHLVAMRGLSC